MFLPYSDCLNYINKDEVEMLLDLSNRRYVKTLKLPKNISKNPIDL